MSIVLEEKIRALEAKVAEQERLIAEILAKLDRKPGRPKND